MFSRRFLRHSPRFFSSTTRRTKDLRLVAMDWGREKDPPLSLGHASILAEFQTRAVPIRQLTTSVTEPAFSVERIIRFLMTGATSNTYAALGAFVWNEPYTQQLLKMLQRQNFPGKVLLGGPQVSYVPQGIEDYYPTADVFVRGYAEHALLNFATSPLEQPSIAGISYAGIPSLGSQAIPDFDNLASPFLTGIIKPQRFIRILTQMGCPFACAFCQHREPNATMKRRHVDLSRVEQEAQWVLENPVIQDIAVLDPTFNSGPNYLKFLAAMRGYTGKLALQVRAEMIKPEFLDAVAAINETGEVVLEIGLQTIHKNELKIIDRPTNLSKISRVFAELRQRNVKFEVSLIFGLPEQTVESFKEAIEFCKRSGAFNIYAFPLMLLRGTPLYEQRKHLQLEESATESFGKIPRLQGEAGIPHVVASPSFTYADWLQMAELAEQLHDYNESDKDHYAMSLTP